MNTTYNLLVEYFTWNPAPPRNRSYAGYCRDYFAQDPRLFSHPLPDGLEEKTPEQQRALGAVKSMEIEGVPIDDMIYMGEYPDTKELYISRKKILIPKADGTGHHLSLVEKTELEGFKPPRHAWEGSGLPINPHVVTCLNEFQKNVVNFVRFRSSHAIEHVRKRGEGWLNLEGRCYLTRTRPEEKRDHLGFIAGKTGSGKTLAVIASAVPRTLVVCSEHLVNHWREEIIKHAPGSEALITVISKREFFSRRKPSTHARLFIDEAHSLTESQLDRIVAKYLHNTFLVTASYGLVCARLSFGTLYASESMVVSPPVEETRYEVMSRSVECVMNDSLRALLIHIHETIRASLARKVKMDTQRLKVVFQILQHVSAGFEMPDPESTLNLVYQIIGYIPEPSSGSGSYEDLPLPREESPFQEDRCPICISEFTQPCQLNCGHRLCFGCYSAMPPPLKARCPYCRAIVTHVYRKRPASESLHSVIPQKLVSRGKIEACVREIQALKPEDRVVVFVQHREVAREIQLLVGGLFAFDDTSDVVVFKRSPRERILLISTRFADGIDLPEANHVFLLDKTFELSLTVQARGRVTRFSQAHSVVHFVEFYYPNCFDDFVRVTPDMAHLRPTRANLVKYVEYLRDHN
jgi:hypothetical protein